MYALRGITSGLAIAVNAVVLCVPLYLMGLLRLVSPRPLRRVLGRGMDGTVQLWVAANRIVFRVLGVTRIHTRWENATSLSSTGWYVVFSNHQSWADILVLQNVLWGRLPMLKFFTKRQLIWVPAAGLAMWFLGFPLVRRLGREQLAANPALADVDREETLKACAGFRERPTAVLSFLEGTRFTPAKHAEQASRFEHLLNPKIGGVSYVVDALKDHVHRAVDVTIVYQGPVPTFWALLQGRCRRVEVLVQCRELPAGIAAAGSAADVRGALKPWVESIWREKDQRLGQPVPAAG